jgi:LysM repeat protein
VPGRNADRHRRALRGHDADLKLWNNLTHDRVRIDQQLRITSDRAAGSGRARSASGNAAKAGGTKRKAAAGGGSSAANGSPKKPVSAAKR